MSTSTASASATPARRTGVARAPGEAARQRETRALKREIAARRTATGKGGRRA